MYNVTEKLPILHTLLALAAVAQGTNHTLQLSEMPFGYISEAAAATPPKMHPEKFLCISAPSELTHFQHIAFFRSD